MSGDVQPRKRKEKRKKKEESVDDFATNFSSEENIHVHKDEGTGGNICAKIVFFALLGVLLVLIGLIFTEYRGSTDLDNPILESRWAPIFDGWVDESAAKHDDHGGPGEHGVEESHEHDEHGEHDDHDDHDEEHDEHDEEHEEEEDEQPSDEQGVSGEAQSAEDEEAPEGDTDSGEGLGEQEDDGDEDGDEEEEGDDDTPASEEDEDDIPGITESNEADDGQEEEGSEEADNQDDDDDDDEQDNDQSTADDAQSGEAGSQEAEEGDDDDDDNADDDNDTEDHQNQSEEDTLGADDPNDSQNEDGDNDEDDGDDDNDNDDNDSGQEPEPVGGKKAKEEEPKRSGQGSASKTHSQTGGRNRELDDWMLQNDLNMAEAEFEENPEAALTKFTSIVIKYPASLRALHGKAKALDSIAELKHSNEILDNAIEEYQKILNFGTVVPDEMYLKVADRCINRMRFKGQYMKAVHVHKSLVARFPNEPSHSNQLAVTYLIINRISEAKQLLQEILKKWPNNGFAQAHYGFILKTSNNNMTSAVEYLQRGINSREPGTIDGRFFFHLADALMRLGHKDEAMKVNDLGVKEGLFLSKYQRSLYNVDHLHAQPWWTPEETTYTTHFKS